MFPYEEAVEHRLIAAPTLKELTDMAAMLDFVLLSMFQRFLQSTKLRGPLFNFRGGGGQGYWGGPKYFFQYYLVRGYFFPAVWETHYLLV